MCLILQGWGELRYFKLFFIIQNIIAVAAGFCDGLGLVNCYYYQQMQENLCITPIEYGTVKSRYSIVHVPLGTVLKVIHVHLGLRKILIALFWKLQNLFTCNIFIQLTFLFFLCM